MFSIYSRHPRDALQLSNLSVEFDEEILPLSKQPSNKNKARAKKKELTNVRNVKKTIEASHLRRSLRIARSEKKEIQNFCEEDSDLEENDVDLNTEKIISIKEWKSFSKSKHKIQLKHTDDKQVILDSVTSINDIEFKSLLKQHNLYRKRLNKTAIRRYTPKNILETFHYNICGICIDDECDGEACDAMCTKCHRWSHSKCLGLRQTHHICEYCSKNS